MITTHVLDTARGRPAAGIAVVLEKAGGDHWSAVGRAETDADGRAQNLVPPGTTLPPGVYRLVFDTRAYFRAQKTATMYPSVVITFETVAGEPHYHVPLLLSPFGYSTYRGT